MKWKLIIAGLLILGIAGLLLFSGTTTGYLNFLKMKVGDFISIIFKRSPAERQFFISLTADKEVFYGQEYKVSNSVFEGSGAAKEVRINNAASPLDQIDVRVEGMAGSFGMTKQKTVRVSGDAARVVLNSLPILNLNIYVEMTPSSFSVSPFDQEKLVLSSVDGQVRTEEGWTKDLRDAYVEVYGFKGSLKLEGNKIILEGMTTKLIVDGKEVTIARMGG